MYVVPVSVLTEALHRPSLVLAIIELVCCWQAGEARSTVGTTEFRWDRVYGSVYA